MKRVQVAVRRVHALGTGQNMKEQGASKATLRQERHNRLFLTDTTAADAGHALKVSVNRKRQCEYQDLRGGSGYSWWGCASADLEAADLALYCPS